MRRWCRALRPLQERRRDLETERLGGLEVDDQLERVGLLYREIRGLGTSENLVDIPGGSAEQIGVVHRVGEEPPGLGILPASDRSRQPVLQREIGNALALGEHEWA